MTALSPSAAPAASPVPGARSIVAAQVAKLALRLTSAAVLARLLTPDAYGLHGMAAAIYGLLYMARDFGVFAAVQEPDLTPPRFNALCRIAAVGGVALAGLSALLGAPAAWFYGEPRVPPVLAALGVGFVFGGFAVPPLALLYREQRVATAMAIDVAGSAVSITTAIAAAAAGWGVWALVVMALVHELVVATAAWLCSPWRPGRDTGGTAWWGLLGSGASLTGHSVAGYFARTVDQIIVGQSQGTTALGYYGRGAQITTAAMLLAIAPFNGWAIATLARRRDHGADFVATFRRLLNGVMHFTLPVAVVCLVAPGWIVRLLYGAAWLPATEVVRWLGLALLGQPLVFAQTWLLQSTNQPHRLLRNSLLGFVAIAGACLLARQAGPAALAAAAAAGTLVHGIGGLMLCLGRTPVGTRDLLAPLAGPALLHGGLWLGLTVAGGTTDDFPSLLPVLAATYYGFAWVVVPAVRRELRGHFLVRP